MTEIYVHMGMHKTGTSAVQNAMMINRRALLKRGVLYPVTGQKGPAHHPLAAGLIGDPFDLGLWKDLAAEIEAAGAEKVVLSSEMFEFVGTPEGWSAMVSALGQRPIVVCYLRRQSEYLVSSYNQHVKNGHAHSFEAHIEKMMPRLDYLAMLQMIEGVVGRDRILLRTYERQRLPQGVVPDFLASLGIRSEGLKLGQPEANPGLSAQGLRIMQQLNKVIGDKETRRRAGAVILKFHLAHSESDKPVLLDEGERKDFDARFLASNQDIARRYLDRDRLFSGD